MSTTVFAGRAPSTRERPRRSRTYFQSPLWDNYILRNYKMNIVGFCKVLAYHLERHDNLNAKKTLQMNPVLLSKYMSMSNVQGNLYNHYEVAIKSGNIQGVCILLDNGFDIHRNNRYGYNPMESAVSTLDIATIYFLKGLGCEYSCQCLYNFINTFGALKTCDAKTLDVLMMACDPEEFLKAYGEFISGAYFDRDSCYQLLAIVSSRLTVLLKDLVVTDLNREFVKYLFSQDLVDSSSVLGEATRVLCFREYPVDTDIFSLKETIVTCIDMGHGYGSDISMFTDVLNSYIESEYSDDSILRALWEINAYIRRRHRLPFILSRIYRHSKSFPEEHEFYPFLDLTPELFSKVMSYLV